MAYTGQGAGGGGQCPAFFHERFHRRRMRPQSGMGCRLGCEETGNGGNDLSFVTATR